MIEVHKSHSHQELIMLLSRADQTMLVSLVSYQKNALLLSPHLAARHWTTGAGLSQESEETAISSTGPTINMDGGHCIDTFQYLDSSIQPI